jgi:hypothetical protein
MTTIRIIAHHREHIAQLTDYLSDIITRSGVHAQIEGDVVSQDILMSHRVMAKDFPVIAINKHPVWQSTLPPEEVVLSWLKWPSSVTEAVDQIIAENPDEELMAILADPIRNSMLAQGIRNGFGLWTGNIALRQSCGSEEIDADDASQIIISALKEYLSKSEQSLVD